MPGTLWDDIGRRTGGRETGKAGFRPRYSRPFRSLESGSPSPVFSRSAVAADWVENPPWLPGWQPIRGRTSRPASGSTPGIAGGNPIAVEIPIRLSALRRGLVPSVAGSDSGASAAVRLPVGGLSAGGFSPPEAVATFVAYVPTDPS